MISSTKMIYLKCFWEMESCFRWDGYLTALPSALIHMFLLTVRCNPSVSGGQESSSFKSHKWLMELYFTDHFASARGLCAI